MIDVKPILRTALLAESAALAGDSFKLARKKKRKAKDFLGSAARISVGTALIKAQADIVEGM